MPEPLTSYISDCYSVFLDTRWDCANAFSHIGGAGNYLKLENFEDAGAQLSAAMIDGANLSLDLHGRYGFQLYYLIDALEWIDDNWPSAPYELTMQKIIEAMWDASPIEYHHFVGYIDAYRANMWNLPYYVEWHNFLTRHFS